MIILDRVYHVNVFVSITEKTGRSSFTTLYILHRYICILFLFLFFVQKLLINIYKENQDSQSAEVNRPSPQAAKDHLFSQKLICFLLLR